MRRDADDALGRFYRACDAAEATPQQASRVLGRWTLYYAALGPAMVLLMLTLVSATPPAVPSNAVSNWLLHRQIQALGLEEPPRDLRRSQIGCERCDV